MRDFLILTIVFSSLPLILFRPYIGILMWSWIGYMNPHRLTWSYAYEMPLAQMVGIVTIIGLLFTRDRGKIPFNSTTFLWAVFVAWFSLTTLFAIDADLSYEGWNKAAKIQLFSFLTIMLIRSKNHIHALLWVIVGSIGFFGLKGGIFTVLTGGTSRVYGPPDSFIRDNNAMALALIMIMPLMWYVTTQLRSGWQKNAMIAVMVITAVSILGSHSRGALLAGSIMVFFLVIKSRTVLKVGAIALLMIPVGLSVMPEKWFDRMETIKTYEEDASAMGRITAWKFGTELAVKRPIGGGFGAFIEENYRTYSPGISEQIDRRDGRFQGSHSIYFRVLGEHGFPGLAIYLALGISAYRRAAATMRLAEKRRNLEWAVDLSRMLQVSIIGYAVGGAFLGLSYFDLYYHLIALVVIVHSLCASMPEEQSPGGLSQSPLNKRSNDQRPESMSPA